jgi:hypothetical protein
MFLKLKTDSVKLSSLELDLSKVLKWRTRLERIESNHSEMMRQY